MCPVVGDKREVPARNRIAACGRWGSPAPSWHEVEPALGNGVAQQLNADLASENLREQRRNGVAYLPLDGCTAADDGHIIRERLQAAELAG